MCVCDGPTPHYIKKRKPPPYPALCLETLRFFIKLGLEWGEAGWVPKIHRSKLRATRPAKAQQKRCKTQDTLLLRGRLQSGSVHLGAIREPQDITTSPESFRSGSSARRQELPAVNSHELEGTIRSIHSQNAGVACYVEMDKC